MTNDTGIKTLIKILNLKRRNDLAMLLRGCKSYINESGQYGTYLFSVLSSFVILSPVEEYYKLKGLPKEDKNLLKQLVLDIYPPQEHSPEIIAVEFRILQEEDSNNIQQNLRNSLKIFLSYSTNDRYLAGKIKNYLQYYGFEVFLAHEDINPSEEWQDIIKQNLEVTDILIPILTKYFEHSDWTDQESGIALVKAGLIIPLNINGTIPYGFLNKYQALKFQDDKIEISCNKILTTILEKYPYRERLFKSLLKSFRESENFEEAKIKSQILINLDLNEKQVLEILKVSINNKQIYGSFGAQSNLALLTNKYKDRLADIVNELNIKIKEHRISLGGGNE
jgi:hypothetical protein